MKCSLRHSNRLTVSLILSVAIEFEDKAHSTAKGSLAWFLLWPPEADEIVIALCAAGDPKHCMLHRARYSIAGQKTS